MKTTSMKFLDVRREQNRFLELEIRIEDVEIVNRNEKGRVRSRRQWSEA
jgi:hypothetical protein